MKISARNILDGEIVDIQEGAVNGIVSIKVGENIIKADITMDAIKSLELEKGKKACAIIKSTSVMIGVEE